jgi:exopolysaccharide biosynthesis polyprenyl glycosylphosphotransferase
MSATARHPEWGLAQRERQAPYSYLGSSKRDDAPALRISGPWVQVTYALIDAFFIAVDGLAAFVLRHPGARVHHFADSAYRTVVKHEPLSGYGGFLLLNVALIVLFSHGQDLYRTPRTRALLAEALGIGRGLLYAALVIIAFIYLTGVNIVSPGVMLASLSLNALTLVAWRYAKRRVVLHRIEKGIGARNAIIIGAGDVGRALADRIRENKLLGYQFKGFLDDGECAERDVRGSTADLSRIVKAEFIDDVFVTVPWEREMVKRVALEACKQRVSVKVVPDLFDGLAWNAPLHYLAGVPVMDLDWRPISALGSVIKRLFDIAFSSLGLLLCAPLIVIFAVWIKCDSEGPGFYRSRRVGRKAREFNCYKLRTMVANANELKESLRHRNERQGPFFKIEDDPRVTRAGRFLRKYSLDELPQLWNVLRGEMSLVGPRPHPVDDYEQYGIDQLRRLEVKPGLTGLWQVTARRDPSFERNMALDLKYIDSRTFLLDLRLLLQTVPVVLRGEGQ